MPVSLLSSEILLRNPRNPIKNVLKYPTKTGYQRSPQLKDNYYVCESRNVDPAVILATERKIESISQLCLFLFSFFFQNSPEKAKKDPAKTGTQR